MPRRAGPYLNRRRRWNDSWIIWMPSSPSLHPNIWGVVIHQNQSAYTFKITYYNETNRVCSKEDTSKLRRPWVGPLLGTATEERSAAHTTRPSGEGSHGSGRNTNKTKRVRKVAARHKNDRGQVEAKSERAEVFGRACLLATRPIYGVKGAKRERSLRKKCPL